MERLRASSLQDFARHLQGRTQSLEDFSSALKHSRSVNIDHHLWFRLDQLTTSQQEAFEIIAQCNYFPIGIDANDNVYLTHQHACKILNHNILLLKSKLKQSEQRIERVCQIAYVLGIFFFMAILSRFI